MSTMQDVWGFGRVLAVEVHISDFCKALNSAAESRGIKPHIESDALDMSRDLMVDEAAHSLGASWEIIDGGTLRLWRSDLVIDWAAVE